jgi:hypothetical protein
MRSKKPTEKRLWKSTLIVMDETNKKKQSSKNSTKPTLSSLMIRKKLTMIAMVLWITMDNEGDSEDLDEGFRGDLMPEIWVIYSHHFSVEVAEADRHRDDPISVRISRCDSGYLSRMRSEARLVVSSSIVRRLATTVVARVVRPRLVRHAVDRDRYASEYRPCLVSWNRLVRVVAVVDEENE